MSLHGWHVLNAGLKVIRAVPCWLELADYWAIMYHMPHLTALLKGSGRVQEAEQQDIPSGPSAWCCTLDADVHLLLTVEEEQQYLERSRKAARDLCANLVPCPQPDCEGMAVVGQGETVSSVSLWEAGCPKQLVRKQAEICCSLRLSL